MHAEAVSLVGRGTESEEGYVTWSKYLFSRCELIQMPGIVIFKEKSSAFSILLLRLKSY